MEQVDALKNGYDGFDKENTGSISATAMQMIFKMIGVSVQVSSWCSVLHIGEILESACKNMYRIVIWNAIRDYRKPF